MNKIKITLLLITTAILLTSCQDQEEGKLDNRVKAYWDAKINKDFKASYLYLTPGWRSTESEEAYFIRYSGISIKWLSAILESKNCTKPDVCSVEVLIKYSYRFPTGGGELEAESKVKENWLLIDNVWYNLPKSV